MKKKRPGFKIYVKLECMLLFERGLWNVVSCARLCNGSKTVNTYNTFSQKSNKKAVQ